MRRKPVVARRRAGRDVADAIDHYRAAGAAVARGFVDELERAFRHISRHASTGSPRYAHELDLPGLRSWRLHRYPHLVFYVEREDHVDVWRVLHAASDIPAWMREPDKR